LTVVRRIPSNGVTPLLGVVLVSQPQVPIATAQQFFDTYYSQVTQAGYRKVLYREDLTRDFRESAGSDWEDYNNWWETWKQVDVRKSNPTRIIHWSSTYGSHITQSGGL
jgi:hypothetical protein